MPPASPPSPVLRRARGLASVLLLASAAGGAYGFSSHVEVTVDGEVHEVRTFAGTVGDVLERLDVEVGTADDVAPSLDAPVEDGLAIDVDRAITVEVHVDSGVARRVTAPVSTVGGVLREAGMTGVLTSDAQVHPAVLQAVDDGDVVHVSLPTPVVVAVDGDEQAVNTFADDVGGVLDELGVEIADDDVVTPAPESVLVGATLITIERVEVVEETDEVTIDHDVVRRESDELRKGRTRVEREGRDGLRIDTYEVTVVDGEETERELVSEEIVREPRSEIVLVGTYEPPPPPAATASTSTSSSSASTSGSSGSSGGSSASSSSSSSGASSSSSSPSTSSSSSTSASSATTSSSSATTSGPSAGVWERLAQCESNGNWQHVSANGMYYGGLQFHPATWRSVGGTGMPHHASKAEQIKRGQILQQRLGWGQWPACSKLLGLR